jgi:hypothetical protein
MATADLLKTSRAKPSASRGAVLHPTKRTIASRVNQHRKGPFRDFAREKLGGLSNRELASEPT